MARASSSSKGAARKVTSFRTSTKMSPSPNMTIGPITGSPCTPWMVSPPPDTMGATRQPSIAASGWGGAGGYAEVDALNVALVEDVRGEQVEDDGES